jgi:hypothetical protein
MHLDILLKSITQFTGARERDRKAWSKELEKKAFDDNEKVGVGYNNWFDEIWLGKPSNKKDKKGNKMVSFKSKRGELLFQWSISFYYLMYGVITFNCLVNLISISMFTWILLISICLF